MQFFYAQVHYMYEIRYVMQSFDYSKNLYDIVQDTYLDMDKNL